MKLPRDLSAQDLLRLLAPLGYTVTRQRGSHIRLTHTPTGQHLTLPDHDPLKPGTLNALLRDAATQTNLDRDELLAQLFGS